MEIEQARDFVRDNNRGVLVTRRRSGGLQMSPVLVGVDGEGRLIISSNEGKAKVANLRREPQASVCVITKRFFGGAWVQIDGRAEVVPLPEAEAPLVDYERRVGGDRADWGDYLAAIRRERACLIRITIERAVVARET